MPPIGSGQHRRPEPAGQSQDPAGELQRPADGGLIDQSMHNHWNQKLRQLSRHTRTRHRQMPNECRAARRS